MKQWLQAARNLIGLGSALEGAGDFEEAGGVDVPLGVGAADEEADDGNEVIFVALALVNEGCFRRGMRYTNPDSAIIFRFHKGMRSRSIKVG